jgi:signal transduction histidine kinase
VLAYYGFVIILRNYRRLGTAEAGVVAIGGLLTVAIGSHTLLVLFGILPESSPRLLKFVAPVIVFGFGGVLVARFVRALRVAETSNLELEARVAERERELVTSFERMRELEAERVVTEERERIMREVHDGMGSQLVSTLAMVEHQSSSTDAVADALRGALDDMRVMIDSLDPDVDDIPAALGMLRMRLGPRIERQGLRFRWMVRDLPSAPRLTPSQLLHVLRIVQESITNVLRHARAKVIEVSTGEREGGVFVRVRDDGQGDHRRAFRTELELAIRVDESHLQRFVHRLTS